MQRKTSASWLFVVRMFSVFWVPALLVTDVTAGENESTRKLVGLVGSDESEKWKEASALYTSIPADSSFKPVASQAMALLQMRQGKYSEAWKLLAAQSKEFSSMPMPFRVGHEKLMLWLWLQAGSGSQAESQFKRLVAAAVSPDLPDPERRDICYFLGGVIGMLQSSSDTSCIAAATLERGREGLEKVESKISLEQFRIGMKAATEWQQALREKLNEFTQLDPEQAENALSGMKQNWDSKSVELTQLLAELKQGKMDLAATNEQVKKLLQNQKLLIKAWNTPTPGKPPKPSEPSKPKEPRTEYETIYTIDSKTGQRTVTGQRETNASRRASNKYDSEMSSYYRRLRQYEIDVQTYPARLAAWTQMDSARRSTLQENKKKVDADLAVQQPILEKRRENVKEKTAMSRNLENDLRQLKAIVAIASIAKQQTESKPTAFGTIAKPSHFELISWESEIYRLEKCLRELPR